MTIKPRTKDDSHSSGVDIAAMDQADAEVRRSLQRLDPNTRALMENLACLDMDFVPIDFFDPKAMVSRTLDS